MTSWISDNIGTISVVALVAAAVGAIGKGFLSKLGEDLYKNASARILPPSDVEVDASYQPHDANVNSYAWVPELKRNALKNVGYSYYNDPTTGAVCFRTATIDSSRTRREYLMRRPEENENG